ARRERATGAPQLLVLLEVDAEGADASGDEGIWLQGRRVGLVTSGSYGHHVRKSLALGYVDREIADADPELTVHVVGDERTARILPEPPYDPKGCKLRDTA
ncbi:MAG: glycine cleavage T C-terminal barrel domain-containing protein, partial [Actinomycetota bacterium]